MKAVYSKVYGCVVDVVEKYKLSTIPIALHHIIKRSPEIRLCPYSKVAGNSNCSVDELIRFGQ